MSIPKNTKDIQVFLGMMGYYRRFIENFSKIGLPLFQLLKKETPFIWTNSCQNSFDTLKAKLILAPILLHPDYTKEFLVQTDASCMAIGAVLSQYDTKGNERPVAFCSRTLDAHEKNYTVTEKECLAVIYACKQFRAYIHGTHFKIFTNHSSLRWLSSMKEPEGRLARWALKLQAYDYEIIHRPGVSHQNADGLSRLPTINLVLSQSEELYKKLKENNYWDEPKEN